MALGLEPQALLCLPELLLVRAGQRPLALVLKVPAPVVCLVVPLLQLVGAAVILSARSVWVVQGSGHSLLLVVVGWAPVLVVSAVWAVPAAPCLAPLSAVVRRGVRLTAGSTRQLGASAVPPRPPQGLVHQAVACWAAVRAVLVLALVAVGCSAAAVEVEVGWLLLLLLLVDCLGSEAWEHRVRQLQLAGPPCSAGVVVAVAVGCSVEVLAAAQVKPLDLAAAQLGEQEQEQEEDLPCSEAEEAVGLWEVERVAGSGASPVSSSACRRSTHNTIPPSCPRSRT
jgi:hypothetical protein